MRLLIHIVQTLLILFNIYGNATTACSSTYGAKPCPYVPSPPGERPPCAKYGYTFCEYPEHYPKDLVMHLLEKWKFDHGTLLQNETPSDYHTFSHAPSDTYGPPTNTISYPYPVPVYGPPPSTNSYGGASPNSYIPPPPIHYPSFHNVHNQTYTQPQYYSQPDNTGNYQPTRFPYESGTYYDVQRNHYKNFQPEFNRFQQNVWNKWNSGKFYARKRRSILWAHLNNSFNSTALHGSKSEHLSRKKRQSFRRDQIQLCESFSQYIMPRAAMNNKGDWMYVVNVPEADGKYSQLVKSETCARTGRCSNLCSVPDGYTSQCEQRYVQKRLVAVEPGGGNLYTDVFWFPSCCQCNINRV